MTESPATPTNAYNVSIRELVIALTLFVLTLVSAWWTVSLEFAIGLLIILTCHEMGHYVTARHYRVSVSLPYFIPFPYLSPFGTMGAVIKMRSVLRSRRVLFDIGIAGPLAGIPPALAATAWGLQHSTLVPEADILDGQLEYGRSLLWMLMERWTFGPIPDGVTVMCDSWALAGWTGLFVTALNLLPVGQLDGGHVLFGIFGRRGNRISWMILAALVVLGAFYPGWWFLVLLLFVTRIRKPAQTFDSTPLGPVRIFLGAFVLLFFVLTFIPKPIQLP